MKIFIKTAGKKYNQDYCWYEVVDNKVIKKYEQDLNIDKVTGFKYQINNKSVSVVINTRDQKRVDDWGRPIHNTIYITADIKEKEFIQNIVVLYLINEEMLNNVINVSFSDSENDFGFEFEKFKIDEVDIFYESKHACLKRRAPIAVNKNDEKSKKMIAGIIKCFDRVILISDDIISDMSDLQSTIFISENTNEIKREIKRYRVEKFIKIAFGVVAITNMILIAMKNNKKGEENEEI